MNWTTLRDAKAQLTRLWERGELLRPFVTGEPCFPLRLTLKGPTSADVTERFDAVRTWAADLSAQAHIRIEWREVHHRVQGSQQLPGGIWVDTLDDALTLLGKRRDANRFLQLVADTRHSRAALLPWLERRPLRALALADDWPRLLAVVGWLADHPRPDVYLRQVDVPGVHTKFIEARRGVLTELFDLALPSGPALPEQAGISQFAGRYGFLDKPTRIRFRVLDERLQVIAGASCPDVTLDADSFAHLSIPVQRVFITENETNFLAFPPVNEALVIFGAGYGWEALSRAHWLQGCEIHYWGDIDTHGFGILDQLRSHFAHVHSFLMDRTTLETHEQHWGEEPKPLLADLPRLTAEERALYDDLRDNRIRKNLRLEQERVGFGCVSDGLRRLESSPG